MAVFIINTRCYRGTSGYGGGRQWQSVMRWCVPNMCVCGQASSAGFGRISADCGWCTGANTENENYTSRAGHQNGTFSRIYCACIFHHRRTCDVGDRSSAVGSTDPYIYCHPHGSVSPTKWVNGHLNDINILYYLFVAGDKWDHDVADIQWQT